MIVLTTGGRDFDDRTLVFETLSGLHHVHPISKIIHGACGCSYFGCDWLAHVRGADGLCHKWAVENRVEVAPLPSNWALHGRKAGPIRNTQMVRMTPNLVIAFPGGAGTRDCARQAFANGLWVVKVLGPVDWQAKFEEHYRDVCRGCEDREAELCRKWDEVLG